MLCGICTAHWKPLWEIDKLYIGNYVCIGGESVIVMGGNNTHRNDWFSNYPFMDKIVDSYCRKGDTVIEDGVWIGMRCMIMACVVWDIREITSYVPIGIQSIWKNWKKRLPVF